MPGICRPPANRIDLGRGVAMRAKGFRRTRDTFPTDVSPFGVPATRRCHAVRMRVRAAHDLCPRLAQAPWGSGLHRRDVVSNLRQLVLEA
jgi:hypothetical protein